jgi:hypothetical protein
MRYLIDPHAITNFERSKRELQTFWLFCVLVAGKNSAVQSRKLNEFLGTARCNQLPFSFIQTLSDDGILGLATRHHKLGQYNRLYRCFTESLNLDLRNCTVQDLEAIHGVGPKTARFFLTHSRPDQKFAILDTHVLRWMSTWVCAHVPRSTPSGGTYLHLERLFLDYCKTHSTTPAKLDLQIWSSYNKGVTT